MGERDRLLSVVLHPTSETWHNRVARNTPVDLVFVARMKIMANAMEVDDVPRKVDRMSVELETIFERYFWRDAHDVSVASVAGW